MTKTEELNRLVAEYLKLKGSDDTTALAFAATAVANFCADVFEKPFVAETTDGVFANRVPHKSSQDVYREDWRKKGHAVNTFSLRLVVLETEHNFYFGEPKRRPAPFSTNGRELPK